MGCCIRTSVRMNLSLPSFIWKPLVNEQLTLIDLNSIDSASVGHLKYIESIDKETYVSAIEEVFELSISIYIFRLSALNFLMVPLLN